MVTDAVVTVAQSTFSLHMMVTGLFTPTPVSRSAGFVELTNGAVESTTTVGGVPNAVDTLPAASFAHGYNVYVPSDATV
jgi:hypothetical protein